MWRRDNFPDNGFESWGGYMPAKIAKLEEQFSSKVESDQQLTDIFNGISIYVNGFTSPSADELKDLMCKHGGIYHTYKRNYDFIIASNLPDTKVKNMSLVKVVKPEWITESIAANKLLDYKNYLLYRNSRTQQQIKFCKKEIDDKEKISIFNDQLGERERDKIYSNSEDFVENLTKLPNSSNQASSSKEIPHNTKTAADPNYISEFYNHSRLHHISQLGACFKQHVNELRESSKFIFPERQRLKEYAMRPPEGLPAKLSFDSGKTIMHIDMDCFFVSVGLRSRPDLRGKPIAVTHSKGGQAQQKRPGVDRNAEFNLYRQNYAKKLTKTNGTLENNEIESRVDNIGDEGEKYGSLSEIASCSYEARAKGIKNGMFMGAALRLCPDLVTVPYDFDGYKEVAYTLYNTIAQYTLDIEAVSCDEMYVDCTELLNEINISVQEFATTLRSEIKLKTGCPCSTGFGGNRLQARLATKKAKPDGQFFLTSELVLDFMMQIKLKDLPGVGRQIAYKLESLGHETCGSLQCLSLVSLQHHLGTKTGAQLYDQCRGCDPNPLTFYTVRKSVSAEVNYGIRFENHYQCIEFLKQLSTEVHNRLTQFKVKGKCITLKLMVRDEKAPVETAKFLGHGYCNIINKSVSLSNPTNDVNIITKEIIALCKKLNIDPKEMRGIGIQITKLESTNFVSKGAITKYLCSNKANLGKVDTNGSPNQDISIKRNTLKTNILQSPKKPLALKSPQQKSPILMNNKSPLKKRGRPPKSNKPSTSRNLMNKFLQGAALAKDIPYRDPMVKGPKSVAAKKFVKEEPSGLLGLSWEKVRELLRAWLDSGQSPLPRDINMISEYMHMMVVNRRIDKLYILLNFFRRRTREMNTETWTDVFDNILEQVQNAMIAVYGKRLFMN